MFFVGLHQPSDAKHFRRCFVSVNRLRNRKSAFQVNDWIMDSGAFTILEKHWSYHERKQGRGANDWRGAQRFVREIESRHIQYSFLRELQNGANAA